MANRASFAIQRVNVAINRALAPERRSAVLAAAAKRVLADAYSSGRVRGLYTRTVDGAVGAPEEAVKPEGVILYQFSLLPAAMAYALGFARQRSPAASGDYRAAWRIYVDGALFTADLAQIPPGGVCMLVNPLPYARKIDVGAMRMTVPPGIVEATRQAVQRQYPFLRAEVSFVSLSGTDPLGGSLPYRLKTNGGSRRKDRQAGQSLTYPALILRAKG